MKEERGHSKHQQALDVEGEGKNLLCLVDGVGAIIFVYVI